MMNNNVTMNNAAANNTNATATMGSGKETVMNNSQTTTATVNIINAPMNAKKALCAEIRNHFMDKADQWIHWAFTAPWKVQGNGISLIYKGYGFAFDKAYTNLGVKLWGGDWIVTPVPADEPVSAEPEFDDLEPELDDEPEYGERPEPSAWAQYVVGTIAGAAAGIRDRFTYEREMFEDAKFAAQQTNRYVELSAKMDNAKEDMKVNAKLTAYHTKEAVKAGGRTIKAAGLLCGFGINRLVAESIDIADIRNREREYNR